MDINVLNINLLLEMHNGSAVTLFGTIFVDDRAKSCSTCLLICCIKQIANSPYNYSKLSRSLSRSVGAPKLRARE